MAGGEEREEPGASVVALNAAILAEHGIALERDAQILDFGCGRGRHVYDYLDRGYTGVHGFDLVDRAPRRTEADAERFHVPRDDGRLLPFDDGRFDFIYSYSVFEHVLDPETALREIYRVLKPGGVTLHCFPARWRPVEAHMYVPFGGVVRSYAYFLFWALLGIRNGYQRGLGARETARRNAAYARQGINYRSGGELERLFAGIFDGHSYEERAFLRNTPGRARILHRPVRLMPPLARLFRFAHTRVVLLEKAKEPGCAERAFDNT